MVFQGVIEKIYRGILFRRYEEHDTTKYFSASDFKDISSDPYEFENCNGETLRGAFYSSSKKIPGRIVIFEHGLGSGHRAYIREIVMLAEHGYTVFAYDRTGCVSSDGESIKGFAGSLSDFNDCLNALKSDDKYKDCDFSVMGHSWGGFSALNAAAYHPDITHVVAMSGFRSVEAMHEQTFCGLLKYYRKHIFNVESETNPGFASVSAYDTLNKTNAKTLVIHSDDDKVVSCAVHFDPLVEISKKNPNVRFLKVSGKNHNPNYTAEAVKYLSEYCASQKKLKKKLKTDEQKKAFIDSFDWWKMTEQDESVWKEIFDTLDN